MNRDDFIVLQYKDNIEIIPVQHLKISVYNNKIHVWRQGINGEYQKEDLRCIDDYDLTRITKMANAAKNQHDESYGEVVRRSRDTGFDGGAAYTQSLIDKYDP